MHIFTVFSTVFTSHILAAHILAASLGTRSINRIAITPHVLELTVQSHTHLLTPSSSYIHKRRLTSRQDDLSLEPTAFLSSDLLTIGGRVYMTNLTLGSTDYTLVIDTGSSDTWVASSSFSCVHRSTQDPLPQSSCGFSTLYDQNQSSTYVDLVPDGFEVSYTDGELLSGDLGQEDVMLAGLGVRQTVGVVERGWWIGDGISSGLMGLAYSGLASGYGRGGLNYTGTIFSLFDAYPIPPIFSLALSRPTRTNPVAGGLLAIGGIPDIPHDSTWASVPIRPWARGGFSFYSIPVDGFIVTPPSTASSAAQSPARRQILWSTNDSTQTATDLEKASPADTPSPASTPAPTKPYTNTTAGTEEELTLTPTPPNPINMTIDSGATNMYLPPALCELIASSFIPAATFSASTNAYTVQCNAAAPSFAIMIDRIPFFVASEDLMGMGWWGGKGRGLCTLAIQRQGGGDAVLGDSWLKSVIAVFDVGDNEMRFAARTDY